MDEFKKVVPLTASDYTRRTAVQAQVDMNQFLDQSTSTGEVEESTVRFRKPYSCDIVAEIENFGDYEELKETLVGPIQLDDNSRAETVFLNKYLGNYDINKIDGRFLIRSGDTALIIKKWI